MPNPIDARDSDLKLKQLRKVIDTQNPISSDFAMLFADIESVSNVVAVAPTEWADLKARVNNILAANI